jgi:catechol 2,3-dioxygenase-like lactoylglutathione lyase family enzyme
MSWSFLFITLAITFVGAQDDCTTNPKWQDELELRFHHLTIFSADVCASAEFWEDTLGYRVMQDFTIPAAPPVLPCPIRDILLTRAPGDTLDIDQWLCPPGMPTPPPGYIHFTHFVNDVEAFDRKMAHKGVTVVMPITHITIGEQVITLACYQGPDTMVFCAGKNT